MIHKQGERDREGGEDMLEIVVINTLELHETV